MELYSSPDELMEPFETGPIHDVGLARELFSDLGWPICGNGVLETTEGCEDGNRDDDDGCDSNCTPTGCGNGVLTSGEECDDGNTSDGDGCSAVCELEALVPVLPAWGPIAWSLLLLATGTAVLFFRRCDPASSALGIRVM